MRRASWLLLLSVLLVGCRSFGAKTAPANGDNGKSRPLPSSEPFWADPKSTSAPKSRSKDDSKNALQTSSSQEIDGVLAGRLVDPNDQFIANGNISVRPIDSRGNFGQPIPARADRDGYFLVQNLKANQTYELVARGAESGKRIAGVIQVRPPNTRLLIRLSEDNVSAITEGPPPAAAPPSSGGDSGSRQTPLGSPQKEADPLQGGPSNGGSGSRNSSAPEPDPTPMTTPDPDSSLNEIGGDATSREMKAEPIADDDGAYVPGRRTLPPPAAAPEDEGSNGFGPTVRPSPERIAGPGRPTPLANIPNPMLPPPAAAPPSNRSPNNRPNGGDDFGGSTSGGTPPPPVAAPRSSQSTSHRLQNQMVLDLNGEPLSLADIGGKYVLLDFWTTNCLPCLQAMPEMKRVSARWRAAGLEVVGIACDPPDPGGWAPRVKRVKNRVQQNNLNYTIVLTDDRQPGQMERFFRVTGYPTLILVDSMGNQVWRGHPNSMPELERILQQNLSNRIP
ncbi:redoxin domain-containing protein [Tuwongella immobilis]|uniref:Thioredoxin domain-containing protein n=1 Tax=Tuwongella immobilis TaxID=692036 RepID=A0A6C2YJS5_9BACT|nr:redoxin domain-containing protein [Tuwongella immobilis]VIP01541.1 alkyl hydroperoxide reductase : Thiol-disulfide isomerase-like thioredoxin OS=Singulisphaera acidiphila (strain ATCC BAA-1392 / DSM 18658 / VKM B-2454 / MOB10) GN=Sinac_5031 PE=4 SV=1: AhpC-TSA [Tuwongella immobilis]VTR98715.1 alkyl hydroperoxide reductase : Thiol-disulfide isomerase-like thioredoxin OS=Singulisphaera acidiphila (strain ATCC BAA-1392 / DSM 18658 / VKM B-2454 / MOB10) GN=Sinac_5031 PE=4 SV=1: AhpC-TSA [Tuwongell